ncbi:SEFIR domain-containing protein [Pseudobacillus wudalianchiensis]|uniref:SEFIR domain-containing protein n=1 Tax=Pseudobacillus wudalianchiensis TaxID=1743143 RepID=A0A1B9B962_9BACI|nr:SEFIR domain-containing protein [Bacillus wudalianchiensis]OCA92612.1 hypothetical protein A8F95_02645 [Bacillus wudalianchiensis]
MSEVKSPRVFISYSWTTPEHEEWVLNLATRLHADDGVEVILDKWDLKDGHEIYSFMESMVRADEKGESIVDKVLLICDKGYQEKADNRKGGAGVESQIVSPEIYQDIKQEKFIPIVAETDDNGTPFLPTYIKGRKYIDLSSDERFEQGYEQLLRNIYQKPQYSKPKKGNPPAWLNEGEVPYFRTKNVLKQLRDAIDRNPKRFGGLSSQFIDTFFESLDELQIKVEEMKDDPPLDQIIYDKVHIMLPLREDFIEFVELHCSYTENLDINMFTDFFETIIRYSEAPTEWTSYHQLQFDHYKFLIHELFLYLITILLKKKRYQDTAQLVNRPYFYRTRSRSELYQGTFGDFRQYSRALNEIRKARLNLNRISITADLLVQRATKKYPKEAIVETDMLLYYIDKTREGNNSFFGWFPETYPYASFNKIELLQRLVSKRHFELVKQLFNVDQPETLKEMIIKEEEARARGYEGGTRIPVMRFHINPQDICTLP